jgi:uncharacterized protein (DUF58 family)
MPLKEFKADLLPQAKEVVMKVRKDFLTTAMAGELASKLKGRGIEFEDYRDYTSSDDASRIDWLASQRSQRLLVREYKVDINFNALFMIDVSESMLFSSEKKLKCEYTAEIVNSIFYGLLNSGNSVGYALFSDGVKSMLPPKMGKKQFHLFINDIKDPKIYGGRKDMRKAVQQVLSMLDKRNLIFLVSDFIDMESSLAEYLKIICHVHEVVGIMVRDKRDFEIPDDCGQMLLEDPFSGKRLYIDSKEYSRIYREYNKIELSKIREIFRKNRSSLMEIRTDEPYFDTMLKFFTRVGARWR